MKKTQCATFLWNDFALNLLIAFFFVAAVVVFYPQTRALICVGLLASCHPQSSLWFMDATGSYAVRAMMVGGGGVPGHILREAIAAVDWTTLSADDGWTRLLTIVENHLETVHNDADNDDGTLASNSFAVEGGILDVKQAKLVRKFLGSRPV
jgi:hypothetical protein